MGGICQQQEPDTTGGSAHHCRTDLAGSKCEGCRGLSGRMTTIPPGTGGACKCRGWQDERKATECGEEGVRSTGIADAAEVVTGCKVASGAGAERTRINPWVTGGPGSWGGQGEFKDETAVTFTMVNGWSRFRSQRPIFTVTSRLSAWTKFGRGPGNLREVESLIVGDTGLATAETMRTGEKPMEWQVQGSPSNTGTVIVKWYVWWRNAPRQDPRSAARYENGVKDVLRRVFRGCPEGP